MKFIEDENNGSTVTSISFLLRSNRVNHRDVKVLDDQLLDKEHRIFEIEKHWQENIYEVEYSNQSKQDNVFYLM